MANMRDKQEGKKEKKVEPGRQEFIALIAALGKKVSADELKKINSIWQTKTIGAGNRDNLTSNDVLNLGILEGVLEDVLGNNKEAIDIVGKIRKARETSRKRISEVVEVSLANADEHIAAISAATPEDIGSAEVVINDTGEKLKNIGDTEPVEDNKEDIAVESVGQAISSDDQHSVDGVADEESNMWSMYDQLPGVAVERSAKKRKAMIDSALGDLDDVKNFTNRPIGTLKPSKMKEGLVEEINEMDLPEADVIGLANDEEEIAHSAEIYSREELTRRAAIEFATLPEDRAGLEQALYRLRQERDGLDDNPNEQIIKGYVINLVYDQLDYLSLVEENSIGDNERHTENDIEDTQFEDEGSDDEQGGEEEEDELFPELAAARNSYIAEYNKHSKNIKANWFSKKISKLMGVDGEVTTIVLVDEKKAEYERLKKEAAQSIFDNLKNDYGDDEEAMKSEVSWQIIEQLVVRENQEVYKNKVDNWPPEKQGMFTRLGSWYAKKSTAEKALYGIVLGTGVATSIGLSMGAIALAGAPMAVVKIALGKAVRSGALLAFAPVLNALLSGIENVDKSKSARDLENRKRATLESLDEANLDFFVDALDKIIQANQKTLQEKNFKTGIARIFVSAFAGVTAGQALALEATAAFDSHHASLTHNNVVRPSEVFKAQTESVNSADSHASTMNNNVARPGGTIKAQADSVNTGANRLTRPTVLSGQPPEHAVVSSGDGIERIFKNQLLDNPEKFGYKPELGSKMQWAGVEAHRLADSEGYVLGRGNFIGLKSEAIGSAAYVLESDGQGHTSVKYLHQENGVWKAQDGNYINDWEEQMHERPKVARPITPAVPTEQPIVVSVAAPVPTPEVAPVIETPANVEPEPIAGDKPVSVFTANPEELPDRQGMKKFMYTMHDQTGSEDRLVNDGFDAKLHEATGIDNATSEFKKAFAEVKNLGPMSEVQQQGYVEVFGSSDKKVIAKGITDLLGEKVLEVSSPDSDGITAVTLKGEGFGANEGNVEILLRDGKVGIRNPAGTNWGMNFGNKPDVILDSKLLNGQDGIKTILKNIKTEIINASNYKGGA